jgi:hypothetical protein
LKISYPKFRPDILTKDSTPYYPGKAIWKANRKFTLFLSQDSLQKQGQIQDDSSGGEASENGSEIPGKF